MTTLADLRGILKTALDEAIAQDRWNVYGLRVTDEPVTIGDELPRSYRWDDGDPTEDELEGTCCVEVQSPEDMDDAIDLALIYWGEQMILVGGEDRLRGQDEGEAVIRGAVALAVIDIHPERIDPSLLDHIRGLYRVS